MDEPEAEGRREARLAAEVMNRLAGCPPAERLQRLQEGSLAAAERPAVQAHVSGCGPCREALEFPGAGAADDGGSEDAERVAAGCADLLRSLEQETATRGSGPRWLRGLAAAAALVLAFLLVPLLPTPPPAGPPAFRQPEGLEIQPRTSEETPLPRQRFLLRWSAGPPGSRYELTVLRRDLTVLARVRDLDVPRHLVPGEALAGLPPGSELLWQVEVQLPDGGRVRSRTFRARLR